MNWRKYLAPILFAFAGAAFLVSAVIGPAINGEPINYTDLVLSIVFFGFAVVFFAVAPKAGGGPGSPTA